MNSTASLPIPAIKWTWILYRRHPNNLMGLRAHPRTHTLRDKIAFNYTVKH